jgi:hypothetical protein
MYANCVAVVVDHHRSRRLANSAECGVTPASGFPLADQACLRRRSRAATASSWVAAESRARLRQAARPGRRPAGSQGLPQQPAPGRREPAARAVQDARRVHNESGIGDGRGNGSRNGGRGWRDVLDRLSDRRRRNRRGRWWQDLGRLGHRSRLDGSRRRCRWGRCDRGRVGQGRGWRRCGLDGRDGWRGWRRSACGVGNGSRQRYRRRGRESGDDRDRWHRRQATRQRGRRERNGRCRGRHQTGSLSQWSSRYGWRWWHDGGHRGGVGRGHGRQAFQEAGKRDRWKRGRLFGCAQRRGGRLQRFWNGGGYGGEILHHVQAGHTGTGRGLGRGGGAQHDNRPQQPHGRHGSESQAIRGASYCSWFFVDGTATERSFRVWLKLLK